MNLSLCELYRPERQVLMFVKKRRKTQLIFGKGIWVRRKALSDHKQHYARMGAKALEDIVAVTLLDSEGTKSFAAGQPVFTADRNYFGLFLKGRQADGRNAAGFGGSVYRH